MNSPRCLLCDRDTARLWFIRKAEGSEYPIFRCETCKSAFVWPRPEVSIVQNLYADQKYTPSHNRNGVYWPSAQRDARRLFGSFGRYATGRVLLDIGAGEGTASAEAIRRGFLVRACEPSPSCRKQYASRNGFEPEATFFNTGYAEQNRHQVDAVLLSHVLEHLPDPVKLLEDVGVVLRPGGVIIIAVPLLGSILTAMMGKKDFFITPPEHLTFFSFAGLEALLRRQGYTLESTFTSSKVNMNRYRNLLGLACYAVNSAAYVLLKTSELFHRSVVLNVCARREPLAANPVLEN